MTAQLQNRFSPCAHALRANSAPGIGYVCWRTAFPGAVGVPLHESQFLRMNITIYARSNRHSLQEPAVEYFARESQMSIDDMARHCGRELVERVPVACSPCFRA